MNWKLAPDAVDVIRGRRLRVLVALLAGVLACVLPLTTPPAASAAEPWERNWHQNGAGPTRSNRVDVAPIRAQPDLAWSLDDSLQALCAPVAWEGTVYVVVSDGKAKQPSLLALDARSGATQARAACFGVTTPNLWLAVWQGTVAVVSDGRTLGFSFRGAGLKKEWEIAGGFAKYPPIVAHGALFLGRAVYDMRTGRQIPDVVLPTGGPTVLSHDASGWRMYSVSGGPHPVYVGDWVYATPGEVTPAGDPMKLRIRSLDKVELGTTVRPLSSGSPARVTAFADQGRAGLVVLSDVGFIAAGAKAFPLMIWHPQLGSGSDGSRFLLGNVAPTVAADGMYVADQAGTIRHVGFDGRYLEFLKATDYPPGSVTGEASLARDVLYPGNWAIDLTTKRVLWTHRLGSEHKPELPLVPSADGHALLRTTRGRLFCLADPSVARAAATSPAATGGTPGAAGQTTGSGAVPAAGDLPGSGDGVFTTSSRWIAGSPVVSAGAVVVTGAAGAAEQVPLDEVVAAIAGGKAIHRGTETQGFDTARRATGRAWAERLVPVFEEALKLELPEEAQRILDEMRAAGMPTARAEELARRLVGRRGASNPEARMRGLARVRQPAEAAAIAELDRTVRWLILAGFRTAAAAVADRGATLLPAWTGADSLIATVVPPEFPWAGRSDAAATFRRWSPWLAAAGAEFLPKSAPSLVGLRTGPWTAGAIGVRTANVEIISRVMDPAVVGPCLLQCEVTVRSLERLLGGRPKDLKRPADTPLVVRLLANKAEYLVEAAASGMQQAEFTSGYFSPSDGISRFFQPAAEDALISAGRDLHEVLVHELTHHWIDMRWLGYRNVTSRRSPLVPGYWVVEGLATFVEDQVVDIETRGMSFDDPTVKCVDTASACLKAGFWLPPQRLIEMNQGAFASLDVAYNQPVRLSRTRIEMKLSVRNLFYSESAALVHYLMNERGPEGRALFVRYLEAVYTGRPPKDVPAGLGFASWADLSKGYESWLRVVLE